MATVATSALAGALVTASLVSLVGDLGSLHAQIALSWAAIAALYLCFARHVIALSQVPGLPPEVRTFWRTLRITGATTVLSYSSGAVRASFAGGTDGATAAALDAGLGAVGCAVLVWACLTFRRHDGSAGRQRRRWLDALTTMVAALGALWYVESASLLRSGVSPLSVALAIVVEALALVMVLALLQPMSTSVRPISLRGGLLGIAAVAVATVVEIAVPHALGHAWLRLVLAARLITPALAVAAVWLERTRPALSAGQARAHRRFSRGPYAAVALTYGLLAAALWFGGAGGRTWGMFAAATVVTALVVVRQSLAFADNATLVGDLQRAVAASLELTQQLHRHAFFDGLTGLPNRELFAERLAEALASAGAGSAVGVMVVDLDDFKLVNDRSGHAAGDEVLRESATRLRGCVRAGDTVARLGGDEFAVVLVDTDAAAIAAAAARIVAAFDVPFRLADSQASIGVSVGTTLCTDNTADAESLLRHADIAMYDAKTAGKRRHQPFRAEMFEELLARHDAHDALLRAVDADEIVVYYQPIVAGRTRAVVGVEALARWQRPGHGLLAPAAFLALAEEIGVICAIDMLVLRAACRQVCAWDTGGERLGLHVNVSAITLARADFLDNVSRIIEETCIRPGALTLELTETALMTNPQALIATMHALRDCGVRLAIDDFGTGYSSLAYLRDLPLDVVKMDRSFVERIDGSETDRELVRMINALAQTLGLDTVAEGVETSVQADFLSSIGCGQMQGYLFARALTPAQIPAVTQMLAQGARAVTA